MDNIKDVSLEQLVKNVVEFQAWLEEVEAGLKVTKDEIYERLIQMKVDGTKVDSWLVKRVTRPVYGSVSLLTARELGAVKEAVDTEKLNNLYKKGVKIPGVKISNYVIIKEVE